MALQNTRSVPRFLRSFVFFLAIASAGFVFFQLVMPIFVLDATVKDLDMEARRRLDRAIASRLNPDSDGWKRKVLAQHAVLKRKSPGRPQLLAKRRLRDRLIKKAKPRVSKEALKKAIKNILKRKAAPLAKETTAAPLAVQRGDNVAILLNTAGGLLKSTVKHLPVAASEAAAVQLRELAQRFWGVAPDRRSYYDLKDGQMFHCVDGRGRPLPASAVNDEYCDCRDGSDEPGTSACANGR